MDEFKENDAVWLAIDDEAIAARFVEYKTCERGHVWCVCIWSDLVLKGKVNAGPEITFGSRAACLRYIAESNAQIATVPNV